MLNKTYISEHKDLLIITLAGGFVLALSFGIRSMFGGIVDPLSKELFNGKIEVFSFSIAVQNLLWGLAQPVFGMIADKYGDRRALWLGLGCYIIGILVCILGSTAFAQHMGAGILVGMGIAGTSFGVVLAVVGRAAPDDKRVMYLGIATALGSVGQVLMPLLVSFLLTWLAWQEVMTVMLVMLLPMALCIPKLKFQKVGAQQTNSDVAFKGILLHAFKNRSYIHLFLGFFVCGFHLAFITAHMPNFVENFCISPASGEELRALGLQALAVVGLANIFGNLYASHLGTKLPKPYVLATIYALRAVVIWLFISFPITPVSVIIFAAIMGVLWLSTVPLTSALIVTMFGSKHMATLYGFVFLSHQLGGFAGVWLGGYVFDLYGNYDLIWHISIGLGVFSALMHLMVKDEAVPAMTAA